MIKFKLIKESWLKGGVILSPLSIFDKMGFSAEATDFVKSEEFDGSYWIENDQNIGDLAIDAIGRIITKSGFYNYVGIRPSIKYSKIKDKCKNKTINEYGIIEVEYGEYPQEIANDQEKLFEMEKRELMSRTGKIYKVLYFEGLETFIEYEFVGRKYVKKGIWSSDFDNLSSKVAFFEVCPVKWLVDEKKNIAICKKILFGPTPKPYSDNFMNKQYNEDIIPSITNYCNNIDNTRVYKKTKSRYL